jgi:CheY-like chemotaxis protein
MSFDVIVTDLTMPGMSGVGLASSVREIRTDIPILLCSGMVSEPAIALMEEFAGIESIGKPYTSAELRYALERVLDGGHPERPR